MINYNVLLLKLKHDGVSGLPVAGGPTMVGYSYYIFCIIWSCEIVNMFLNMFVSVLMVV